MNHSQEILLILLDPWQQLNKKLKGAEAIGVRGVFLQEGEPRRTPMTET